jgi:hypothetical protein
MELLPAKIEEWHAIESKPSADSSATQPNLPTVPLLPEDDTPSDSTYCNFTS